MQKVIKLEEPDTVPHAEMVAQNVREAILPGATFEEFVEHMDFDGVTGYDKLVAWKWEMEDEAKGIVRDQWGGNAMLTSDQPHPMTPAITSEKDLDGYVPPDPDDPAKFDWLKAWLDRFKGERCVTAHATDVFDIARESLLGDVLYFTSMITNPQLIERVNEIVLDYNIRYLKNCIELGADSIFISGDFATTTGPMVSRDHTKRFLTEPLRKMVEQVHDMGVTVVKHSDGDIMGIFDLILDTGIDGIHPIDPMAGMDLGEVKEKYGDRICLMGNVSCAYTLCEGTFEEVRKEVKECIKKAGPGGGYVCTSSNSIHSGVKPENYVEMVKAIREYGKYPLELD
jgi:uroporphyrinogen decarboxylase